MVLDGVSFSYPLRSGGASMSLLGRATVTGVREGCEVFFQVSISWPV